MFICPFYVACARTALLQVLAFVVWSRAFLTWVQEFYEIMKGTAINWDRVDFMGMGGCSLLG